MTCFDLCPGQLFLLGWWELRFFKILEFYNLLPVMGSMMLEPDLPSGMRDLFSSSWDFCQTKALRISPFEDRLNTAWPRGMPSTREGAGAAGIQCLINEWEEEGSSREPQLYCPNAPTPQPGTTHKGYSRPKAPLGNRLRVQCNSISPSAQSCFFSLPCPSLGVDPKSTS